jgi:DNA topoisomerase IA
MKYLVIVESPAKEKTISKILGNDYTSNALTGILETCQEHDRL